MQCLMTVCMPCTESCRSSRSDRRMLHIYIYTHITDKNCHTHIGPMENRMKQILKSSERPAIAHLRCAALNVHSENVYDIQAAYTCGVAPRRLAAACVAASGPSAARSRMAPCRSPHTVGAWQRYAVLMWYTRTAAHTCH